MEAKGVRPWEATRRIAVLSAIALVGFAAAGTAAAYDREALDEEPQILDGRLVLPAWETSWEKRALLHKDTEDQLDAFRAALPEVYGVTLPPAQPVTFYAEFDPVDAVYFAWEPGVFDEFFHAITREVLALGGVELILLHHGAADRTAIEAYVRAQGDDPAGITFVDTSTLGPYYVWVDEWPWTVDYGPFFVEDGLGVLSIVDPRYVPWRVNDDAIPTKLAGSLGVTAYRPDLDWDGGNLFSDGAGTCYATGLHVAENIPLTQGEIDAMVESYFGCAKMIWLEPAVGDGTGHIDMFFKPASATSMIVGQFDPGVDDYNAAILDRNAALLESETNAAGDPITVLRLPMPPDTDGVFRSYTNGILVNDLVLVPVYPEHAGNEAEALAVMGDAFPGRTIVGIDSEGIIEWGGAIHCVTRTRPVGTLAASETPGDACGGAFQCVGGCGTVDFIGECVYGLPVYCDAVSIYTEMCYLGERCGWDLVNDYVFCVPEGCMPLPPEGECRTTTGGVTFAVTCVDGYPEADRCDMGEACAVFPGEGLVRCGMESCDDECTMGEAGCFSYSQPWSCGEAGDGDGCNERLARPACPVNEGCDNGYCRCFDTCEPGEGGCTEEGEIVECSIGGDSDECYEFSIWGHCPEGTRCVDDECIEVKETMPGCGCSIVG